MKTRQSWWLALALGLLATPATAQADPTSPAVVDALTADGANADHLSNGRAPADPAAAGDDDTSSPAAGATTDGEATSEASSSETSSGETSSGEASSGEASSGKASSGEPPVDDSPSVDAVFVPDAEALQRENQLLELKLELAEARLEVETERARRATALVQLPEDASIDPDAPREPLRFYAFNLSLTALTRNISAGLALRYLWAFQTDFTADVLLTPLINGLSLDDLDSIRFTAAQTVAWRLSMFPFKFMPRNVQKPAGPWPDLLFGAGVWGLLEADHLAQAFRLGDAGLFVAATVGPFIGVTFQDVTLSLAYRPFSIAAFFLDGVWDQRPFAFGNPVLDVAITWTLPL